MNNLLLLCITLFVITHKANGQDLTAVEIRERTVGGLLKCAHTFTGSIAKPTNAANNADTGPLPTTTDGSGQGAVVKLVVSGGDATVATNAITVVAAGSGYAVGDKIIVAAALLPKSDGDPAGQDFSVVLTAADIADGSVKCQPKALTVNPTDPPTTSTNGAAVTIASDKVTSDGNGDGMALTLTISGNAVTFVEVTAGGSGYEVGEVITVAKEDIPGSTGAGVSDKDLVLVALTAADIEDIGKKTVTGGFRDSEGNVNAFSATKTGYYTALSRNTNRIQVKVSFTTAGSVIPELNGVTDTTLANNALSSQIFTVKDGLNTLKLVSSVDGTYEINLIKPDDYVKAIMTSKRSVEISYNPGAVGEFTCSAFADGSGLPTTRDNVKTGTGSVAKSVRTHNILPENRYNSVQMTLNGLTPSTIYDIHCFHLSHGIISNTAASVETDLASLTGVSIAASDKSGEVATDATVTITFTHEKSLGSGDTITLSLYTDFDNKQAFKATVTDCSAQVAITSNGNNVAITSCAEAGTEDLLITLSGTSTVTGTSGNVMIITLTQATALQFADNALAGAVVTYDLDVSSHGKLLQQDGWVTE